MNSELLPSDRRPRLPSPSPGLAACARFARRLGERAAGAGARLRAAWHRQRAQWLLAGRSGPLRLCLGDRPERIAGWIHVDGGERADLRLDPCGRLPLPDRCVALIYAAQPIAPALLGECARVLEPGGTLRLASAGRECSETALRAAGFVQIEPCRPGASRRPELAGLDGDAVGARIVEARVRQALP
jgi:hypothetical protein